MKRLFCLLFVCILFVGSLSTDAFARADVAAYRLTCSDLPAGTEYVDLLIKLPTTDPRYTPLVEENLPEDFSENAQIITYCADDYRSYTFHYKDALSQISVDDPDGISFLANGNAQADHIGDITARGNIKLSMLDANGNIIKVSAPLSLKPKGVFVRTTPYLHYDAQSDTLDVGKESYFLAVLIIFIIILVIMVVHCVVKWLIAQLFDIWILNEKLILLTGALTYIFQWSVLFVSLTYFFLVFPVVAFILVILPLAVEIIVYRWKMQGVSLGRCLSYTLVSNFFSLIAAIITLIIIL